MFDLDQSIAAWRQQLIAAGLNSPAVLDELEAHLREDITRQTQTGLDGQSAFAVAVQSLGPASKLKAEFMKPEVLPQSVWSIVRCCGINGFLITLAFNLIVLLAPGFNDDDAVFFSPGWLAYWFPAYTILLVLAAIGASQSAIASRFTAFFRILMGLAIGLLGLLLVLDGLWTFDASSPSLPYFFSGVFVLGGIAVCWCAWKVLRGDYAPASAPRRAWFSTKS